MVGIFFTSVRDGSEKGNFRQLYNFKVILYKWFFFLEHLIFALRTWDRENKYHLKQIPPI
jgi:hypothetical protein